MNGDELFAQGHQLEFFGHLADLPEIERLYRAAAAAGSLDGMTRLGFLVEGELRAGYEARVPGTGAGNLEEAIKWYRKAAEGGHAQAAFLLGRLYAEKLGDWANAEPWYRRGAAGGNQAARERLAEGPQGLVRRRELDLWLSGDLPSPPGQELPPRHQKAGQGCAVLAVAALLPLLLAVFALVTKTA